MKTIESEFTRWGDKWALDKRTGDIALLLQAGRNWNVAIVQHSEDREIAGRPVEGGEYLPGETQYGRLAWNYGTDRGAALAKFDSLCAEVK